MQATEEKKIYTFEAPAFWWAELRRIGAPSGAKPSQLIRDAVYDKYLKGGDNGDSSDREGDEESSRKSA